MVPGVRIPRDREAIGLRQTFATHDVELMVQSLVADGGQGSPGRNLMTPQSTSAPASHAAHLGPGAPTVPFRRRFPAHTTRDTRCRPGCWT
jgi:hypothetical protein